MADRKGVFPHAEVPASAAEEARAAAVVAGIDRSRFYEIPDTS
jgi:hypothetical protein